MSTTKLVRAVEHYLTDLRKIRASGGGTGERSYYPPLTNLLNAVGSTLKPKVFCISELAQQGAGHPDIGLYAAKQVQKGKPRQGQIPECGVLEVKSADDDALLTTASDQVSKYWGLYRLVLVTNTRDFVLLGEDSAGNPAKLATFRLAESVTEFESRLQTPRAFANNVGAVLGEYLSGALSHRAALVGPKDLAQRVFIAHAAPGSKNEAFAHKLAESGKPLLTLDSPANANLMQIGTRTLQLHGVAMGLSLTDTADWGTRHAANIK